MNISSNFPIGLLSRACTHPIYDQSNSLPCVFTWRTKEILMLIRFWLLFFDAFRVDFFRVFVVVMVVVVRSFSSRLFVIVMDKQMNGTIWMVPINGQSIKDQHDHELKTNHLPFHWNGFRIQINRNEIYISDRFSCFRSR